MENTITNCEREIIPEIVRLTYGLPYVAQMEVLGILRGMNAASLQLENYGKSAKCF